MMPICQRAVAAVAVIASLQAGPSSAQVWLLDFGADSSFRGASQTGLDQNGNTWNSFPPSWYVGSLVTTVSQTTGAAYAPGTGSPGTDSYNGPLGTNVSNPLTQAEVDAVVIDAAALGLLGGSKAAAVDYQAATEGRFAVKWLNPHLTYDATFFGSFMYAADDTRVAAFSDGSYATEVAAGLLDVGRGGVYNAARTVALNGLVPTANDGLGRQLSFQFGGASGTTNGYLNSMSLYGYIGYLSGGTTVLNGAPAAGYVAIGTYPNGDARSVDTMIGGDSTVVVNSPSGIYWNSTLVAGPGGGTIDAGIDFVPYRLAGAGRLAVSGTGLTTIWRPGDFSGTLVVAGGNLALTGAGALGAGTLELAGGVVRPTQAEAVGAGGITLASGITTIENAAGIGGLNGSFPVLLSGSGATLQCWGNGREFSLGSGTTTVQGFNNLNAWAGGLRLDGEIVGSGTINWWGSGSLTVTGSNGGFTGRLIAAANNGTLALANVDALRSAVLSSGTAHTIAFTVPGDATYNLGGLAGAGSIALGGNSLAIAAAESHNYSGSLSGSGGVTIGGGTQTFSADNAHTGDTVVQAGVLRLAAASAVGASRVVPMAGGVVSLTPALQTTAGALDPAAGGLVDVGTGLMTVASGLSVPGMLAALVAGRGDGTWNGTQGITSSSASADLAASIPRTVGWLDNGDGSVSFAFAAQGDTNLDWNVDILDAANFLAGGKFDTGVAASWNEGDFGYDGIVDILDAADFLSNGLFDAGVYNGPSGRSAAVAAVPEPTSALLLVSGVLAVALGRRASRRRHLLRVAAAVALVAAVSERSPAQVWLLDFGASNSFRGASQVGIDANGNVWNSFPPTFYTASLVTTVSQTTGAAYAPGTGSPGTDSYNGPLGTNVSNPLTQAEVDAAVIDSAALGLLGGSKAGAVDYQSANQGRFAIKWLNQNLTYDATFFGSFKFAAEDTRVAAFSDGTYATEVAAATLDVGRAGVYNASRTIALNGLVPTATDALGRQLSFQFGGASGTTAGYLNSMSLYGYIGYLSGGTTTLNGAPVAGYVATGTYANGDARSADTMIGGGSTVTVNDANGIYWNSTLVAGTGGGVVNAGINFGPYCLSGAGNLAVGGTGVFTLSRPGTFTGTLSVAGGAVVLSSSGALGSGRMVFEGGVVRPTSSQSFGSGGLTVASGVTTIENTAAIAGLSGAMPVSLNGGGATLQCWGNGRVFSLGTGTTTVTGFNNLNAWDGGLAADGPLAGSGTLNWFGSGTLAINGASSGFAGQLIAGSGVTRVSSAGSLGGASAITINGGTLRYDSASPLAASVTFASGVLSGTGGIATPIVTGSGAVLSPGNSPGTQEFAAGLSWAPGGAYAWELNSLSGAAGSNSDLVTVSGSALDLSALGPGAGQRFTINLTTLTGSNTLGPLDVAYVPGTNYTLPVASYGNGLVVPSGFSSGPGTDLTSLFNVNLSAWQGTTPSLGDISVVVDPTGSGLSLFIVPEPAAEAFAAAVGLAAIVLRRRRRTSSVSA
jgi:autotransporter-associated beta strand protein